MLSSCRPRPTLHTYPSLLSFLAGNHKRKALTFRWRAAISCTGCMRRSDVVLLGPLHVADELISFVNSRAGRNHSGSSRFPFCRPWSRSWRTRLTARRLILRQRSASPSQPWVRELVPDSVRRCRVDEKRRPRPSQDRSGSRGREWRERTRAGGAVRMGKRRYGAGIHTKSCAEKARDQCICDDGEGIAGNPFESTGGSHPPNSPKIPQSSPPCIGYHRQREARELLERRALSAIIGDYESLIGAQKRTERI